MALPSLNRRVYTPPLSSLLHVFIQTKLNYQKSPSLSQFCCRKPVQHWRLVTKHTVSMCARDPFPIPVTRVYVSMLKLLLTMNSQKWELRSFIHTHLLTCREEHTALNNKKVMASFWRLCRFRNTRSPRWWATGNHGGPLQHLLSIYTVQYQRQQNSFHLCNTQNKGMVLQVTTIYYNYS